MYTKLLLEVFFINHVTNILTEVVPYYKLGHNLLLRNSIQ